MYMSVNRTPSDNYFYNQADNLFKNKRNGWKKMDGKSNGKGKWMGFLLSLF